MGLPIKKLKEVFSYIKMKKYLVIGSPINHSLSPKLHNYWFSKTDVQAIPMKKRIKVGTTSKYNI